MTTDGFLSTTYDQSLMDGADDAFWLSGIVSLLRHVQRLEIIGRDGRQTVVDRDESPRMRFAPDLPGYTCFGGPLSGAIRSTGREFMAEADFGADLTRAKGWPDILDRQDDAMVPQKALPHGAVALIVEPDALDALDMTWCVFLPVTNESRQLTIGTGRVQLFLHGYFFVTSGRNAILGFDHDMPGDVSAEWNARVRDQLVLPLLPGVLMDAVKTDVLTTTGLEGVVAGLNASQLVKDHCSAISSREVLARTLRNRKIGWTLNAPNLHFRPLPAPETTRLPGILELVPDLEQRMADWGLVPTVGANAVLAPVEASWRDNELARLVGLLTNAVFCKGGKLARLGEFLDVARRECLDKCDVLVTPLLGLLRQAMIQRDVDMAEWAHIRAVLRHLPDACVLPMPPSVMRNSQLRSTLAAVETAPLCVHQDWLPASDNSRALTLDEAKALLKALQNLLRDAATEEAAATAAMAILKAMRTNLSEAQSDPEFRALHLVRVDKGLGSPLSASLDDLAKAAASGRLFAHNNENRRLVSLLKNAAPGADAMMIQHAEAAQLLTELGDGLRYAKAPVFETARLAAESEASGPEEARLDLLHKVWSSENEFRPFLRAILAGRREARFDDRDLLWIEGGNSQLDDFALSLAGSDDKTILLSAKLLMKIDAEKQSMLGVRRLDGATLGKKFVAKQGQIASHPLSPELFAAFFTAGIPDEDLARLPIFETSRGRITAAQGYCFNPDLPFPKGLEVPVLYPPMGLEAQEQFRHITSVRIWTAERQLEFLLGQSDPAQHATEIIAALRSGITEKTRPLLAAKPWLPLSDGRAAAPESVLHLPGVSPQALPRDIAKYDDIATGLIDEDTLHLLRKNGILKDADASREALLARLADGSLPCWIGKRPGDIAPFLQSLAREGAMLDLPGWPLLAWLLIQTDADAQHIVREVQMHTVPNDDLCHRWMESVSSIAAKGNDSAHAVYRSGFGFLARTAASRLGAILAGTLVPTRKGTWRPAQEVVAHGGAVAFGHRLDADLARLLSQPAQGLSETAPKVRARDVAPDLTEAQAAESLRPILARAKVAVPSEMLAVLVTMLGRSRCSRALIGEELGLGEPVIDGIARDFDKQVGSRYRPNHDHTLQERAARMRIQFRQRSDLQGEDEFLSLAGTRVMLPLGNAEPLEIVGIIGQGWKTDQTGVMRRALDVVLPCDALLTERDISAFCHTLAEHYIGSDTEQGEAREEFQALLAGRARFSEHVATAVRAEIRDQMPKILGELKPKPNGILSRAQKAYDDGVLSAGDAADDIRAELKRQLWMSVDKQAGHEEMLERVRARIEEHGYAPARIFFELFQNADDAWQQDPGWSDAPGRFELERDRHMTRLRHWGRLINIVRPGSQGESLGWHRDLYHMLLLNLSDKNRTEAVTGRFGLGFKSVHLLADQVRIASRHVACHVRGGLLPDPWDKGKELSFDAARHGRPATIIEFDQSDGPEYDKAWVAFRQSARWLPAMARGIRQLEIRKEALVESFGAEFEETAAEGVRLLTMTGTEAGKALVFDLDEDTTMFLPLGPTGPVHPAEGTPGLWLLAPLDVDARPRWLMNSRSFRVDPGRGHLSGTLEERKALFRRHGSALARRLEALAALLAQDWPGFAALAGLGDTEAADEPSLFWTALADSFAPDLRHDMLGSLHVDDTRPRDMSHQTPDAARLGWARLVCETPVFPTRLPAPFAPLVRATEVRWQLAGVMERPGVAGQLEGHPAAARILSSSVSGKAARTLERIGVRVPSPLDGGALLAEVLRDSSRIDPDLAEWLGRILVASRLGQDEREDVLGQKERAAVLDQLRSAEFRMADGTWGKAALMPPGSARAEADERMISAFVSSRHILSDDYTDDGLGLYELARGGGHLGSLLTPAKLAQFARECKTTDQKRAVVVYMLRGEKGSKLAEELRKRRCHWLPADFETLCASEFTRGLGRMELQRHVLPHLYASEHEERLDRTHYAGAELTAPEALQLLETSDPELVLESLHKWWDQNSKKLCGTYDLDTYPANSKPERLRDRDFHDDAEGWFTFFAQAVFRNIEWGNTTASRNFIKGARREGWWGEMARISQVHSYKPWTDRLDELASIDGRAEDYRRWRRALGELYVVARWLPEYVDVFMDLPRFVQRDGEISLADHWWPSASASHQKRGTEGASLIRALGTGANWMIREGVRGNIWGDLGGYMHDYGWANSAAMRRFASRVGWRHLDCLGGMDDSRNIYAEFETVLRERASFGGALDLPVQLLMTQKHEGDQLVIFGSDRPSIIETDFEEEDIVA